MYVIIDRFEGEYAIVEMEDKRMLSIPRKLLPPDAREGDVISITIDRDETERRKQRTEKLMGRLWKD